MVCLGSGLHADQHAWIRFVANGFAANLLNELARDGDTEGLSSPLHTAGGGDVMILPTRKVAHVDGRRTAMRPQGKRLKPPERTDRNIRRVRI